MFSIHRRYPFAATGLLSLIAARFFVAGTPPRWLWQLLVIPGYLWGALSGSLARPFRSAPTPLGDFFYFVAQIVAYFAPLFVFDLVLQRFLERRKAGDDGN